MNPKDIVRDGYDRVSYAYRNDDARGEAEYSAWVAELKDAVQPGEPVLDLGCGCGIPVTRWLSAHYRVTGVDLSPVQIQRAHELVPAARFICADMCELNFEPGSFAAIVALYSIIHVPREEQRQLLSKIATWLQLGGTLIATLGAAVWMGTEQDWLGVKGGTMYWSHADAATYRGWIAEAGFEIVREEFIREGANGHQYFRALRVR